MKKWNHLITQYKLWRMMMMMSDKVVWGHAWQELVTLLNVKLPNYFTKSLTLLNQSLLRTLKNIWEVKPWKLFNNPIIKIFPYNSNVIWEKRRHEIGKYSKLRYSNWGKKSKPWNKYENYKQHLCFNCH